MPGPQEVAYGTFAKVLHWLVAALLLGQFALGWLMPAVRRGMQPGPAMHAHISIGIVALTLIVIRWLWRSTHHVAADPALLPWQRTVSTTVHVLLYVLVLATTLSGWFYASARGWPLTFFGLFALPGLVTQGSALGRALGEAHEVAVWALLGLVSIHVGAALLHAFVYHDRVMQRMLFRRAARR